jgi:hypothetical protein
MFALTRVDGWPERLAEFLDRRQLMPFSWGLHDCALFAADAVKEITGVDVAEDLRGTYNSAEQALRILKAKGGLRGIVSGRLPLYLSPLQAHRGDVVCVLMPDPDPEQPGREILGIVAGNGFWAAPGERRVEYRPMAEVRDAFAVG